MRYTTKTEYGLMCLIQMAQNGSVGPITIKQLSGAENYSVSYVEKILQSLRASNIVQAAHGNQGGYVLAKDPAEISLKEVITALEGNTFGIFCDDSQRSQIVCNHFSACGLKPVWENARQLLDDYFESVTLDKLITAPAAAG